MSHQTRTIVLASIAVIVAASLIAINPSTMAGNAQAQMYANEYGYDNNYYQDDNRYSHDKKDSKSSHIDIQKIKCVNSNINVNGIEITQIPQNANALEATENDGTGDAANTQQNGNALADRINVERNLVNVCANVNANEQLKVEPPEQPTTATLTVKKEVFGCDHIVTGVGFTTMDCQQLQDGSDLWLSCIGSLISSTPFCQNLPPNLFDIQVLDDQNIPIQEFEGSTAGTTIQNLQPGTYTVNEIKHATNIDQLGQDVGAQQDCTTLAGFADGGTLHNEATASRYFAICFEYEDEQDNDCSTVTLAPGEDKTCTVKNYIRDVTVQTPI